MKRRKQASPFRCYLEIHNQSCAKHKASQVTLSFIPLQSKPRMQIIITKQKLQKGMSYNIKLFL